MIMYTSGRNDNLRVHSNSCGTYRFHLKHEQTYLICSLTGILRPVFDQTNIALIQDTSAPW